MAARNTKADRGLKDSLTQLDRVTLTVRGGVVQAALHDSLSHSDEEGVVDAEKALLGRNIYFTAF